jgi:hypothetical protein
MALTSSPRFDSEGRIFFFNKPPYWRHDCTEVGAYSITPDFRASNMAARMAAMLYQPARRL